MVSTRAKGSGCPFCNLGWTLDRIRLLVRSLRPHLPSLTPAELYVLFQQSGALHSQGRGRSFVDAFTTGRFPREELDRFLAGEPSLADRLIRDSIAAESDDAADAGEDASSREIPPEVPNESLRQEESRLPAIEAQSVLAALGAVVTSADAEAIEFLVASASAKLWKHAYHDATAALAQVESYQGRGYAQEVKNRFLTEYRRASELPLPAGYAFTIGGRPASPNLMQCHVAEQVRARRRVGNWSGTGAGKTLSAILASRVVGAGFTVICCPNSVVDLWRQNIIRAFPNSLVATKTFRPEWGVGGDGLTSSPGYLVLNYEAFQQPDSAEKVAAFIERDRIDFIVVDEIQFTKQRVVEDMSQRRRLITALATEAARRNPDLYVLGMSATPVINNLQEGKSLVELITGVEHPDLQVRPTVANSMQLHQRLVTLGTRWLPEYDLELLMREVAIDCADVIQEVRSLGQTGTPLALEQILTRARLPVIKAEVRPKTLIYTHYIEGIDQLLYQGLTEDGWRVGFFTGEEKSGLDAFLNGDLDVLIASSAIATGVDGLQEVCNRLIVNVLPWTAAEFDQLKGRLYRQGQRHRSVTVVLPLTFAEVNGQRWSWCESKMARLRFKRSLADAAVDGVVPEGHLRSPAQAYQDVMAWLARLQAGGVQEVTRQPIVVPLPVASRSAEQRRRRRYGDFSQLNHAWNASRSETTHTRLQANPEEWAYYHTLYREARKDWAVTPYEEIIRWCEQRRDFDYVIGDFGCGEAQLADALDGIHTVHSFDHVAMTPKVIACDMAHVPLDDASLDVAVFSLSLMGSNLADYLREAHRTLRLDGFLHIIEATSRLSDSQASAFVVGLRQLGFDVASVESKWKFTHIRAIKSDRKAAEQAKVDL